MHKICIIGPIGAGKTTFAKTLGAALQSRTVEIDHLKWEDEWKARPRPEVMRLIKEITSAPRWIVEGHIHMQNELGLWSEADKVIWLDYSLGRVLMRLLTRTVRRIVKHEVICNGNFETWRTVFSRHSILLLCCRVFDSERRYILNAFEEAATSPLIRFTNPHEAKVFLMQGRGHNQLASKFSSQNKTQIMAAV